MHTSTSCQSQDLRVDPVFMHYSHDHNATDEAPLSCGPDAFGVPVIAGFAEFAGRGGLNLR
jgi:hypothetical protein